ncbi:MAG TPA: glycosyltransferase, partial [Acidimicrobiia bacterium]|nr:glycosyltransferase [Acidimicrobiia bacterium]
MKIALVSEHASPLATIGEVDAGGQNVHVAELARGLAECNADVTVYTRRDRKDLPRRVQFVPGVTVQHVDAGPAQPVAKDELLPYMNDFARELRRSWKRDRPDVVHAHFWMSGSASLEAARPYGIPVVQTFHALGIEKKGQQGARDTSPGARIALEAHL